MRGSAVLMQTQQGPETKGGDQGPRGMVAGVKAGPPLNRLGNVAL